MVDAAVGSAAAKKDEAIAEANSLLLTVPKPIGRCLQRACDRSDSGLALTRGPAYHN